MYIDVRTTILRVKIDVTEKDLFRNIRDTCKYFSFTSYPIGLALVNMCNR